MVDILQDFKRVSGEQSRLDPENIVSRTEICQNGEIIGVNYVLRESKLPAREAAKVWDENGEGPFYLELHWEHTTDTNS